MTGLKLETLVDEIAAVTITGVRVRGMDNIPAEVGARDCPLLSPKPNDFVANLTITRDSFGTNDNADTKRTVTYDLRYVLFYTPIGAGRNLFDQYADFVHKAIAVQQAVAELESATDGVIDITCAPVVWGVVQDAAGNAFHGCEFSFNVTEFYEV
jgi:hypothetical protein